MKPAIKAAVFVTLALVLAVLLTRCDALRGQQTTSTATTPNFQALPPSKMKREWLGKAGLTESTPTSTSYRADKLSASILKVAWVPGVQVVSLDVYSTPKLASPLAPLLVLAVGKPAYFLRHQLKPILSKLSANRNGAHYVLVVDMRAKRVLEWYGSPARGRSGASSYEGGLYVRPDLFSCSPIMVHSPPPNPPPCPSK